ncbi:hypothetical protein DER45DRAFT_620115 [Fusarium avenaceum]|nr:hypothetical protein DER45DRAFT_620115 [Fusarium avenaceum]
MITIASELANEKALEYATDGARGLVVLSDLKLQLSSGAKFMGEFYKRGDEVRERLDFWGKEADSHAKFTEDVWRLGGHFAEEYKGKERATLDIDVSRTTQKVPIDGTIRLYDIEPQTYINADLQTCSFEANIIIKIAEIATLTPKVDAHNSQQLENTIANFEAHLELSILNTIIDGTLEALEALTKWAPNETDKTEDGVEKRLGQLRSELAKLERKLMELRAESQREVLKKLEKINEENKLLRETADANWQYWTKTEEGRYLWKVSCQSNLDDWYLWDKPYSLDKLTEATIGLKQAHASKNIAAGILHAAEAITSSPAFRAIEDGINTAIDEGPMGYIEEMSRDEKRDLQRQIDRLEELENDSRDLQRNLE